MDWKKKNALEEIIIKILCSRFAWVSLHHLSWTRRKGYLPRAFLKERISSKHHLTGPHHSKVLPWRMRSWRIWWQLGSTVEESGRKKISRWLWDISGVFLCFFGSTPYESTVELFPNFSYLWNVSLNTSYIHIHEPYIHIIYNMHIRSLIFMCKKRPGSRYMFLFCSWTYKS